jgi:hypothetical protein
MRHLGGIEERCIQGLGGADSAEDLGVNGRIILIFMFEK